MRRAHLNRDPVDIVMRGNEAYLQHPSPYPAPPPPTTTPSS